MARIFCNPKDVATFVGEEAQQYAYHGRLRRRISEIVEHHGDNRFFVLDGDVVRAAQTTEEGARRYMEPGYVLLELTEIPG